MVRDSAGVTIVTVPAPDSTLPVWTIETGPDLFRVGDTAAGHGVRRTMAGAIRLPDGSLIISSYDRPHVRRLDPTGREVPGAVAFMGFDPGAPPDLLLDGDTLVAVTTGADGVGVFLLDPLTLRTLRQYRMGVSRPNGIVPLGRVAGGSLILWSDSTPRGGRGAARGGLQVLRAPAESGGIAVILDLPSTDWFVMPSGEFRSMIYGREAVAAVGADRIFTGTNDAFTIDVWSPAGRLVRSTRIMMPPQPVTPAMRAKVNANTTTGGGDRSLKQRVAFLRNAADRVRFAETARFYERLYPTEDGGVWVELFAEYEDPLRRFLVLDSTGRPVARLSFDRNLRPRTIWADSALLMRRTESSNQELFLGRIIRPTTPPGAVPAARAGTP